MAMKPKLSTMMKTAMTAIKTMTMMIMKITTTTTTKITLRVSPPKINEKANRMASLTT